MTPDLPEASALPDAPDWRRLDPLTLVLAVVMVVPRMAGSIPALIGVGVIAGWRFVAPAALVVLLLTLGGAWVGWLRFRYLVAADTIRIDSGVFARQQRVIPFDRVQDVSVEQPLVARLLGLARVRIDSGGGTEDEGVLNAVSLDEAARLRDVVRRYRSGADVAVGADMDASATVDMAADDADPLLYAMDMRRLLTAGLFNFSLAILAGLFGVFQMFDDVLPFDPFDPDFWTGLIASNPALADAIAGHQWLSFAAGLVMLILLGFLTGIVGTVRRDYAFRLTRTETGLRRRRGLTTRTDVVMPLAKVQAARIETGPVRRACGWFVVKLQSLASDGSGGSGKSSSDHLVAPLATEQEAAMLAGEAGVRWSPGPDAAAAADAPLWRGAHPVQQLGLFFGALALIPVGLVAILRFAQPVGWLALAGSIVVLAGAVIAWRRFAWRYDGAQLNVRRGWWNERIDLLPVRSVQSAEIVVGPVLRLFGLATLRLGVPGGGGHVVDAIPVADAHALRAALLDRSLSPGPGVPA